MTTIYSEPDIEFIRESSLLVSKTLAKIATHLRAGITTLELDKLAETFILSHDGAIPSFKNYKGYPFSICSSINHAVVHGFPKKETVLQEGDVVSIDVGVYYNGFHGDSAFTFYLNENNPRQEIARLLNTTRYCLNKAIEVSIQGNRVGDIGHAVQEVCEANGYGVVRELTGHGIGRDLHESPNIPNYGNAGKGTLLQAGMVIAIEPMITLGSYKVQVEKDGWTVTTKDKKVAAHFEHTVSIEPHRASMLSDFSFIDKAVALNSNLIATWNTQ